VDGDGFYTALDCQGADGINGTNGTDGVDGTNGTDGTNGLSCWDLNGNGLADAGEDINGDGAIDAIDCQGPAGADGTAGVDGINGINGIHCWDLNGNGVNDADEDLNRDGVFNAYDCIGLPGPASILFDMFLDDFFTDGDGDSTTGNRSLTPTPIEEPAIGPTSVVAYRWAVPQLYFDEGYDDASFDQNAITMRLYFWREGPVEDCFTMRLDAYRARHGTGITPYGAPRYVKLDDPATPNPFGTMVVVDLPLNNADGGTANGLGLPADLRVGDFLAFEFNIVPGSTIDPDVSYAMLGVEFFESAAEDALLQHATVFATSDDVDCSFYTDCDSDSDCNDGYFCNGEETCSADGLCQPGAPVCPVGKVCDETYEVCVGCDGDVGDGTYIICHKEEPDFKRTLRVQGGNLGGHLGHGDTLGPCEGDCPAE
jgi:hypothetical protein